MVKKGLSLKKRRKLEIRYEALAWKIAREMTQTKKPRDNLKHFCEDCKKSYCHTLTGQDEYCHECRFHKNGCLKETSPNTKCLKCNGERRIK